MCLKCTIVLWDSSWYGSFKCNCKVVLCCKVCHHVILLQRLHSYEPTRYGVIAFKASRYEAQLLGVLTNAAATVGASRNGCDVPSGEHIERSSLPSTVCPFFLRPHFQKTRFTSILPATFKFWQLLHGTTATGVYFRNVFIFRSR